MPSATPRILLVDDEMDNLRALERTLRGKFEIDTCLSAQEALAALEKRDYAIVVSDQRMPGVKGTELLAQVAQRWPLTTRVILTAFTDAKEMLDAINRAEIYRYITKPWDNQELISILTQAAEYHRLRTENRRLFDDLGHKSRSLESKELELKRPNTDLERQVAERTKELTEANSRLNELAMTDPLTRVMNRRAFFARFDEEIERSRRYRHGFAVAMIDVDHFKPFNDMEGHLLGDEALKSVARLIKGNIRKTDLICRYGGEEFCLLMPETRPDAAEEICERLRSAVETTTFQGTKGPAYLTVSIGVAAFPADGETRDALVAAADAALYDAKRNGRNRVVCTDKHDSVFFS